MFAAEVESRHTRQAVEDEIRVFEERIAQLRRGEITDDELRPFRLKHGIYGQRQPGFQMVRVKVASGVLTPDQLNCMADIAELYGGGRGHLTTRENIQFHFILMENVPDIMRRLAAVGLTTREACGNTVRNITSCPLAGICGTEAFDVTPYALATTRFFLRHPEFHNLPRKFKIAFSGCEDDGNCAVAAIHDVGLIARVRGLNGAGRRGFKIMVGGGLASLPTEAATLNEFLPEEELIPTIEAVLRVFNQYGNRKNKYMARLKFVLRAKGIDELRRLVAEKRAESTTPPEVLTIPSPVREPLVNISATAHSRNGDSAEFNEWMEHNFQPQRQAGYATTWIKLYAGTVTTDHFRGLASVLEKCHLNAVRIAINQDLVIPWVPEHLASQVFDSLHPLGLAVPGARTIADVTGCPGATTCNLGITRSHTLSDVLAREFASETDPLVQEMKIKISGCPNSCGQHHIADLGLYGNARKVGDQQAPYYQLMLGGRVASDGAHFGRQVVPIPAKHIPQAFRTIIDAYKSDRHEGEKFPAWADRTPDAEIIRLLEPHLDAASDEADLFFDWGDDQTYSLKLGRGECAA
jgi:sulfite reductase beta subunit-like hemoprotein